MFALTPEPLSRLFGMGIVSGDKIISMVVRRPSFGRNKQVIPVQVLMVTNKRKKSMGFEKWIQQTGQ
jgi:hypothetical protein